MNDAALQKLLAMMDRLTNQGPPVINVNISLADLMAKKKKSEGVVTPEEQATPASPGYPRPYVS